jgi:hypothetical protein
MKNKLRLHLLYNTTVVLLVLILQDGPSSPVTYTVGLVLSILTLVTWDYGHLLPQVLRSIAQIIHDLLHL